MAVLPRGLHSRFRGLVQDGMMPGLTAVRGLRDGLGNWRDHRRQAQIGTEQRNEFEQQVAELRLREQRLLIENARSQDRIRELEASTRLPQAGSQSSPLVVNELLTTRVLGGETAARLQRRAILQAGEIDGVDEAAFVLDGGQPLLDTGMESGVDVGLDVYSGRFVVGRISRVGRWTSSLRLITDSEYQALARLGRPTESGMLWGTLGRLKGEGTSLCRLSIDAKQIVSEGDLVFTGDRDGALPDPMLYGRVVKAKLRPGAVEWEIWVEPAAELDSLQKVHVLRQTLNPLRVLAQ